MEHQVLSQSKFRGLYARGISDDIPPEYFKDCLNNKYVGTDVASRDGLSTASYTKANIVRKFLYKRLNETPRFIVLDSSGNLYDSLYANPIYTDATFVDFSMVNINNRAYISPHNRIKGISSKSVLVYEGDGTARLAAGVAPTGFVLGAANAVTSGDVEEGYHLFMVVYETSTGFITAPGPAAPALLSCPGGFDVDISALPIGPTGTAARIVLATKSIPVSLYNGNPFGYEFFYVPDGVVANNSSTGITISFFDADLIDSADYLFNNLATIPAGVFITAYKGRMVVGGESGNEHIVRASEQLDPETFSAISGYITVDTSETDSGVQNAIDFRDNLVITKDNQIYGTTDNGAEPNTWPLTSLDKSAGAECFGISTILDHKGSNSDRIFLAARSGLLLFDGMIRRPELTWNIEAIWKRINKAYFNLIQVVDDPLYHRLLVTVPLDSATAISHTLYADYSDASVSGVIDPKLIKWSIWTFPTAPVSITGDTNASTGDSVIHFAFSSNIYDMKPTLTADFGNAIESYFRTSFKTAKPGWINHFGLIQFRATGSATIQFTLYGNDDILTASPASLAITAAPGKEYDQMINFVADRMSVRFRVTLINETYQVNRLDIEAKPIWRTRAA